ncbi:hypothetical protein HF072_13885 [Bacillus sp. RO3]|nr:hypothetical protein [Bacillus sp. RO3]
MSFRLEKKEWIMIVSTILLMISIVLMAVWFFYLPVKNQKEHMMTEIKTEEKLIAALDSRIEAINQDSFENSSSLQQKVPVKPLTQQLLLDLEKAEIVSDSYIKSIEFTEGAVDIPLVEEEEQLSLEGTPEDNSEPAEDTKAATSVEVLPEGLQKLTATLTVDAKSYFEIEEFIKELEELHRLVEVEEISFSGPQEIQQSSEDSGNVSFGIVVSAFYLPGLVDLESELPKLDAPYPANKKNPFQQFPGQNSEE